MSLKDFLRSPSGWTAEQLRGFLEKSHPEDYNLVDVGQQKEFEAGHLPGARSIPSSELHERMAELKPALPTIITCDSGVRSRAAGMVLLHGGFSEVHYLKGGMRSWRGRLATGVPEADFSRFAEVGGAEEQTALAWYLEEGTRLFYADLADRVRDAEPASLFRELTAAEEHHQSTLLALYEGLSGRPAPADFPSHVLPPSTDRIMEGGMRLDEALEWARNRPVRDILELGIALETNAYDRYLMLRQELEDENARRVFEVLSDEEKRHLTKLSQLLDHFL